MTRPFAEVERARRNPARLPVTNNLSKMNYFRWIEVDGCEALQLSDENHDGYIDQGYILS